jgi:hypothetical protein
MRRSLRAAFMRPNKDHAPSSRQTQWMTSNETPRLKSHAVAEEKQHRTTGPRHLSNNGSVGRPFLLIPTHLLPRTRRRLLVGRDAVLPAGRTVTGVLVCVLTPGGILLGWSCRGRVRRRRGPTLHPAVRPPPRQCKSYGSHVGVFFLREITHVNSNKSGRKEVLPS